MREWPRRRLTDVAAFAGGAAFPRTEQGSDEGEYPFLKVSDMNAPGNERVLMSAANWISEDTRARLGARVWPEGTTVFPKVGAALKTEKRRMLARPSVFDNNVMGLVPGPDILPRYLFAAMEQVAFAPLAQEGVVPSVNQRVVGAISIPLPPRDEQARIVSVLDALDAAVDAAQAHRASLAHLLRAAVNELVPPPNGSAVYLGDVTEIRSGVTKGRTPKSETRSVAFLRAANVQDGRLDLNEIHSFEATEDEIAKASPKPGDVLMTEGGSLEHVGRGWVWTGEIRECITQNHVYVVRPDPRRLDGRYLAYIITARHARRYCLAHARKTNNLASLNKTNVSRMPLALPSIAEQERVISQLDAVRSAWDAAVAKSDALRDLRRAAAIRLMGGRPFLEASP